MSGEDANPLNRRLPAEVITRQSKVKKVIEKISDDVQVDLKVALSLKPEARLRWLSKAFKMVEEKKVPGTELYDIVSNRKFCGTMQSKNSQKLRAIVAESMAIFSDKQQRFLRSDEWAPNKLDEDREANLDGEGSAALPEGDESPPASTAGAAADSQRRDSKGAAEPSIDAGGGWTWTVRERPLPESSSSNPKKKKPASNDTEASPFEKTGHKNQALSQKQQEEEVDSSLQLLERLNQHKVEDPPAPAAKDRRREEPKKRRREPSRSRSISAASLSSSSRGRRRGKRRKDSGGKKGAVNFEDALRRRMQERESQVETSRLPVVDPGHARKAWR